MKKVFLFLAAAAMLFAGCKKEDAVKMQDLTKTEFTVQVPALRKAAQSDDFIVSRIIMQVVDHNSSQIFATIINDDKSNFKKEGEIVSTTFQPELELGHVYDYLFWADNGDDYYVATDLREVTAVQTDTRTINTEKLDAFAAVESVAEEYTEPISRSVTLVRPFGQLMINATDIDANIVAEMAANGVALTLTYSAPAKYNVLSGAAEGDNVEYTGEATAFYTNDLTVAMDYIFAPKTEKTLVDFNLVLTAPTSVTKEFTSIPMKANYITKLTGKLFHTTSDWDVDINPNIADEDERSFEQADDLEAANAMFAKGATKVDIKSITADGTLYLPVTTQSVEITLPAGMTNTLTITYGPAPVDGSAGSAPGRKLAPAEGDKPASVTIHTENADKVVCTGISNIIFGASTIQGLHLALVNSLSEGKASYIVMMDADMDASGYDWKPIGDVANYPGSTSFYATFDGKNHIISNLKVEDKTPNYACAGLFGSLMGTVKNVTLKDVNISSTHWAGGIVAYSSSFASKVENCKVIGGTIASTPELLGEEYDNGDKVGGIFGYNGEAGPITNCSVEGVTITGYRDLGGIAGAARGTISGCSVKNCIIKQDETNGYKAPGAIDTYAEILGNNLGATLTNNTFENVIMDPAFVCKVNGKGYKSFDAALAAATAGQTVQILQAGDYTVQTLNTKAAVVEATVEGVVFNRTPGGSVTSYGTTNPVTVKNITWNIGSNNYQYFNCVCENCTINGRITAHTMVKLINCTMINTYGADYNVTTYASPCIFEGCTFKSQGKFVNVYGETTSTATEVKATNCKFVNLKETVYKAAFNVKGNGDGQVQHAHVVVANCTTEGKFPDHTTTDGNAIFFDGGLIMFDDPAWEDDVYAVVDGVTYRPNK